MSTVSTVEEQNAWAALRSYRQGSKKSKNLPRSIESSKLSKSQIDEEQTSICSETRIKPFSTTEEIPLNALYPKVISNIKIEDLMKHKEVGTPFDLIINIEDPLKTLQNDESLLGTQKFSPPMDLIGEICSPKDFCFGLESTKHIDKPLLSKLNNDSKLCTNDSSIGHENYHTKDTEQDQSLIEELRGLVDKKEALIEELKLENQKLEEQLKEARTTLNQTRKDNSRRLKSIQKEYEREIEGIKDSYEEQITQIKNHYEAELKQKDEEYEILNALLAEKQSETARRIDQSLSSEYEEVIRSMKEEFEDQINKLNAYYQKKLLNYEQENSNLDNKANSYLKEIADLQSALKEARLQARSSSRDHHSIGSHRNSSTDRWTARNRENLSGNKSVTTARGSSIQSIRALQSLIAKINKYIDSDSIEGEITPNNRKNLYEKVSKMRIPTHMQADKENIHPNVPHKMNNTQQNFAWDESSIDQLGSFDEETAKLFNNSIKNLYMNLHANFNPPSSRR